ISIKLWQNYQKGYVKVGLLLIIFILTMPSRFCWIWFLRIHRQNCMMWVGTRGAGHVCACSTIPMLKLPFWTCRDSFAMLKNKPKKQDLASAFMGIKLICWTTLNLSQKGQMFFG